MPISPLDLDFPVPRSFETRPTPGGERIFAAVAVSSWRKRTRIIVLFWMRFVLVSLVDCIASPLLEVTYLIMMMMIKELQKFDVATPISVARPVRCFGHVQCVLLLKVVYHPAFIFCNALRYYGLGFKKNRFGFKII